MKTSKHSRLFIFSMLLLVCGTLRAQEFMEPSKQEAIKTIAHLIASRYFDVEKGGQLSSYLLNEYNNGSFSSAKDWKSFDQLVTKSMANFSRDGHLFVRLSPETVADLRRTSSENGDQGNLTTDNRGVHNYGFEETTVLDGNIGYLKLSAIMINKKSLPILQSAMKWFKDTKALIIDLRNNGGGGSEIGPVLESYFLPAGIPLLTFRNRDGIARTDSTVNWITENKYEKPVYIIVNNKTASAAEAFAWVMQQNKRAKIVGERSAGAANMTEWFPVNDGSFVSVSVESPALPGKNISWEGRGISPEIRVRNEYPVSEIVSRIQKN